MSKMRIHNPLTGEVITRRIPMRWTPKAKLTMTAGAAGLIFFGYFANEFFANDWQLAGFMFSGFFGAVAMLMYKFYKAIRLWSNIFMQQVVMAEEFEKAMAMQALKALYAPGDEKDE